MKKVLVIRYGAFGDCIFISHLPRLLKDIGYDVVDFEVNHKGFQVLGNNPFIDNLRHFEPRKNMQWKALLSRWEEISKGYDKVINLFASLESGCIAMESDDLYSASDEQRREELGCINFYDQTLGWAGLHEYCGKYKPELFFDEEEVSVTEKWLEQFKGRFLVLINLAGTSKHKRFIQAEEVSRNILKKYKNAQIILTGDDKDLVFSGENIVSIVGEKPFMQAVLISKYCDCVISMESGLGVGSNVFGTPTIFLLTSSNHTNVCKYAENDLCLQSPAKCSPCHKGSEKYIGCDMKDGLPICVNFNINEIMERVEIAYRYSQK